MLVEEPWPRRLLEAVSYIKKNQLNLLNGLKKFLIELFNVLKIIEIDFNIKHFYPFFIKLDDKKMLKRVYFLGIKLI